MTDENKLEFYSLPVDYSIQPFEDDRFLKIRLKFMHDGINPNGSNFDLDVIKMAEPSISNIPILASIQKDAKDFGEHDVDIEESFDEAGNKQYKTVYYERPIGVVPAIGNNYHYEMIEGRTYAFVDAYIWKEYAQDEADILMRDKVKKMSMEIKIDDFSYDPKQKITNISRYAYMGLTLLGDKFGTGMLNARAEILSYSKNSEFSNIVSTLNKVMKYSNNSAKVIKIKNDAILAEKYYTKKSQDEHLLKIQLCHCLNNEEIIKEAFLDVNNLKFLHHKLVNNQLIIDKKALELCANEVLKYASNNEFVTHLYNHYKQLDMDTTLFEEYTKKGDTEMAEIAKKTITIDNSKEASTSGKWSNPGKALYEPCMEATNAKALLNEAYLDVEAGYEDAPSTHLKYPHHVISGDKLIVHKDGVEAAFARLRQQGTKSGSDIDHLKKHYKELELNMENFEEFSKDPVDIIIENAQEAEVQEKSIELQEKLSEQKQDNFEEEKEEVQEEKEEAQEEKEEVKEEEKEEFQEDSTKAEAAKTAIKEEAIEGTEQRQAQKDFEDMCNKYEDMKAQYEDMKAKYEDMYKEYTELKSLNDGMVKKEKVEEIKNEFSQFSSILSDDEMQTYVEKAVDGDKEEVLKELKAFAFDKGQINGVFTRATFGLSMNIPSGSYVNSNKSVWEKSAEEVK